jgi:hypothetical protein
VGRGIGGFYGPFPFHSTPTVPKDNSSARCNKTGVIALKIAVELLRISAPANEEMRGIEMEERAGDQSSRFVVGCVHSLAPFSTDRFFTGQRRGDRFNGRTLEIEAATVINQL